LGDFDALVLLLMSHAKGQVVVEDFGFYSRAFTLGSYGRNGG
jgi:hypothetical protein